MKKFLIISFILFIQNIAHAVIGISIKNHSQIAVEVILRATDKNNNIIAVYQSKVLEKTNDTVVIIKNPKIVQKILAGQYVLKCEYTAIEFNLSSISDFLRIREQTIGIMDRYLYTKMFDIDFSDSLGDPETRILQLNLFPTKDKEIIAVEGLWYNGENKKNGDNMAKAFSSSFKSDGHTIYSKENAINIYNSYFDYKYEVADIPEGCNIL